VHALRDRAIRNGLRLTVTKLYVGTRGDRASKGQALGTRARRHSSKPPSEINDDIQSLLNQDYQQTSIETMGRFVVL